MQSRQEFFKRLNDSHPFITVCEYSNRDYVGIIQNRDDAVTTMYDYGAIVEPELKELFIELGDQWWWGSNRLVPIHLFLKQEWAVFRPYIRTFSTKNLTILHGPACSIAELSKRKSKRKSITLVRKL